MALVEDFHHPSADAGIQAARATDRRIHMEDSHTVEGQEVVVAPALSRLLHSNHIPVNTLHSSCSIQSNILLYYITGQGL